MGIFKKIKVHHIYKEETIKEKCKKMRDQISLNLYYINRAQEKFSGSKLVYIIKRLQNENEKLYYEHIIQLRCHGHKNIHLTMEPK